MPLFPTAFDASQFTLGILAAARGGTGVSNTGTLTNASNTTITGGGTLALGGFTLTVPATGTAALLQVANTFTLGPNAFRAGADGNVALSARRHSSGASANMLELQNESGTALSYLQVTSGGDIERSDSIGTRNSVAQTLALDAGDSITVAVWQSTGGAINITDCRLRAFRLGP